MNIDGVSTGIVLDHIKAGKSMQIYELLRLDKLDNCVAVIQNADSSKYGKKDIIKIDQLIDLELPETLTGVIKCKNPRCITSIEQEIVHKFKLVDKEKQVYRCVYCDAENK